LQHLVIRAIPNGAIEVRRDGARGQILVLFVLLLVGFLGMAALAIDVSGVFSELRFERGTADAAALAGASDVYRQGSNTVGAPEYRNARGHAMQNLMDALDPSYVAGNPLPTCAGVSAPYDADIVNCQIAGTPYYVTIKAPAPSCAAGGCDAVRSVQVTVRNPRHGLAFARIFGQEQWNLAVTSVAERNRGTNYSFVTLRPPKPSRRSDPSCAPNCDANDDDIGLDGSGTTLTVHGDMGTNTNMILTNGATVSLPDTGAVVDRYDAYKGWLGLPNDRQIAQPVPDPMYAIPTTSTTVHSSAATAEMSIAECQAEVGKVPASYNGPGGLNVDVDSAGVTAGAIKCFKPGRYMAYDPGVQTAAVKTLIFSPGVYFFDAGLHPGNNMQVIGGYEPGMPGVAFVFQAKCTPGCEFTGNALDKLVLNAGATYPSTTGTTATAAVNWDGTVVQTTGRTPFPMTLIVQKNPACFVALTDPCDVNPSQWRQLTLPGGSNSFVYYVQYAPTDNVFITGGSGSDGYLGQIWAWTVKYTGGTRITLIGASDPEPGVLRIATPCSPGTACTNPEAAIPIP
jgi:hypothetical protein